ncbi:long-chain fatty acid--CoA ligase [Actinosynnema sp. NPDC047251]|uniref:Long-chain-fatty-acid-CoA ligase n=1 Tax=Saccharothrix espanaensis (strain ATCC 51144 / DSM 44229 / JCM 9112 / NBRC 15066 / NRRL 15764) TaxID=1179773 RepID=K0JU00_SACES|nr:long-chain fatty acid--CoA ligase [Saccharothrix espanaensis]CCH31285.1 Long-chain-fatty-acid-CoA ligase [Saccharothrix espanaensis DSM 44229]
MNLASILVASAARFPDRAAVKLDDVVLTYADLDAASARTASLLREAGVQSGDRVGLLLPNVPHFAVLYYGILRAGAVVVPMNPLLKSREIEYHLADSGAALLLGWHEFAEEAAKGARAAGARFVPVEAAGFAEVLAGVPPLPGVEPREPSDTAVILYTSGTTGRPKGAELTHDNLTRNTEVTRTTLVRLSEHDVIFGGLPLFHSFGQVVGLNCAISAGAGLTLLPRFDPAKAVEIIRRDRVTVFAGVPTMYGAMLTVPERGGCESLRVCVSGGAAMPVEVLRAFEDAFGCTLLEGYGLSETSPVACFNHPDRPRKAGSIGTPVAGVEMRVLDPAGREVPDGDTGEIAVRGHNVMKGYWRNPEATAEAIPDGWLRTGDLGVRDEDGCFRIVDRKKDLIIRGGFNVYPREIEELLYEHPAVAEVAVVGVPHPLHGEEVVAVVALKAGSDTTPEELREFAKSQVAPYKYPRAVQIVDALPKGPTGKILKREITPTVDVLS